MSLNNRRHETTESGKMTAISLVNTLRPSSHMQSPQLNRKVSVIGAGPEVG